MEKIATDTYSFEDLRRGGFVYVDKTAILRPLADGSVGKQFFIARPRRFGKSLAVSTLKCLFEGRRELFGGLAIEPGWDWTKRWPVIHLDMGSCQAESAESLRSKLHTMLVKESERLGVPLRAGCDPADQFGFLLADAARRLASADGKVVLLVDEYDKPLLGRLGQANVAEFQRELKAFYSVIKTNEGLQRFALVTGVSKFSKVSIFSDLNNLNEFSMVARVAELFGYTHGEVRANFPEALAALGARHGLDPVGIFSKLARWYNGYRFEETSGQVFNPVSVGKCLSTGKFEPFWFETGTPTFLLKLMAEDPIEPGDVELPITSFSVYEPSAPAILPLLYQTGYLTIKGDRWDGEEHVYRLGTPNLEVAKAFSSALSLEFSRLPSAEHASLLTQMCAALRGGDVDDMLDALSCFFANIPANITVRREKYYQSLFYAVFVLIGARVQAECWTNRGRIAAVVETAGDVYVFEFKLDGMAEAALAQISERGYHERFLRAGKRLTLVGAAFDAGMRNLSDRRVEVVGR